VEGQKPATTLDYARRYVAQGWCVVPIATREKRPLIKAWQTLRLTPDELAAHFHGPCNVGVNLGEPSGGLADVDLDAPEALQLAPSWLPSTLTFGRASKPRSHFLYRAPGAATVQFRDPRDRSTLVELRATPDAALGKSIGGSQTVLPPSTHPTGERVRFEAGWRGLPLEVDALELRQVVAELAAAALVMRRRGEAQARALLDGDPAALEGLDQVDTGWMRTCLGLQPPPATPAVRGGSSGGGGPGTGGRWLEELRRVPPDVVARALGVEADRQRGMRPCPSCGADNRSSHDRRPAVGFITSADGTPLWTHAKCGATGSSIQMASLLVLHTPKPQDRAQWAAVHERLTAAGVLQ
jgi:hypothetical protein